MESEKIQWDPTSMLEITIPEPDAFLKIKETLTRIGVASKHENVLYPSCHILHKKGRYYIVHFKELFALEGRPADISEEDISRRNTIAKLLEEWDLCSVLTKDALSLTNMSNIKVVAFKDKSKWDIRPKFKMMADRIQK